MNVCVLLVACFAVIAVAQDDEIIESRKAAAPPSVADYPPYQKPESAYPVLFPAPIPGPLQLPNPGPMPGPLPAPYPAPYPGPYPEPFPQPSPPYNNNGYEFQKLRTLRAINVVKANIKYYTNEKSHYAIISCPRNPTAGAYTWILADSDGKIPSFGIADTVALAGGLNVQFLAKYGRHEKWEGRDFTNDEKQRFRRVGCVHGNTPSHVQN